MPRKATSTKPPAVKAAVLAKYEEGKPRAQIARELHIDRETVTRILTEFRDAVESSVPAAVLAVERRLEKGDANFALRYLKAAGVLDRR